MVDGSSAVLAMPNSAHAPTGATPTCLLFYMFVLELSAPACGAIDIRDSITLTCESTYYPNLAELFEESCYMHGPVPDLTCGPHYMTKDVPTAEHGEKNYYEGIRCRNASSTPTTLLALDPLCPRHPSAIVDQDHISSKPRKPPPDTNVV